MFNSLLLHQYDQLSLLLFVDL